MTRDELLDALTAERYDHRWWTTPAPDFEAVDTGHTPQKVSRPRPDPAKEL